MIANAIPHFIAEMSECNWGVSASHRNPLTAMPVAFLLVGLAGVVEIVQSAPAVWPILVARPSESIKCPTWGVRRQR